MIVDKGFCGRGVTTLRQSQARSLQPVDDILHIRQQLLSIKNGFASANVQAGHEVAVTLVKFKLRLLASARHELHSTFSRALQKRLSLACLL